MEHEAIAFISEPCGYLFWVPLLPLLGFLANGLGWIFMRERWPRPVVNLVAVSTVGVSFVLSAAAFLGLRGLPEGHYYVYELSRKVFENNSEFLKPIYWISAGGLDLSFKLVFDRLSAVMCLVVTGVGGLIHLYSTGYMAHDKSFARYFAYLNLFTFAMLTLVMGGNLVLMFVGWEGVGLCSYLLIGFWFEDDEKASAGKKAFIVNRIGDFGFLIGIFTLFWIMKTLDFYGMREWLGDTEHVQRMTEVPLWGLSAATIVGLVLFVGACGKSAQIPLFVWLPDAMAGPTPVSALIHAATMVTAGVYMIGRMNFLYALTPTALMVVAAVGVITALFSATIGLTQNDIKKVLAYSTVSQLGYMFTAMGVGAYSAGIFHLTTHAFFKALLFLGAGSVIHGLGGEQDLRKMGGLRAKLPITCFTMVAAWLAITGCPGLSGFVSKDEILWKALSNGVHPAVFNGIIYAIGLVTAALTAIYMTRLMMMAFFTGSRMDHEVEHHAHESPWNMTVPLIILAALSVLGGLFNWPKLLLGNAGFEHWLEPMWAPIAGAAESGEHSAGLEIGLMALSVAVALVVIAAIYFLYKNAMDKTKVIAEKAGPFYRASLNKYWVDEIYDALIVEPIKWVSYFLLFRVVDVKMVDGTANGIGRLTKNLAELNKRWQTGQLQTYAAYMAVGLVLILYYFFGMR